MKKLTVLQRVYQELLTTNLKNENVSLEDYEKKVHEFGVLCFRKAYEGKLFEIDYNGKERKIKGNED